MTDSEWHDGVCELCNKKTTVRSFSDLGMTAACSDCYFSAARADTTQRNSVKPMVRKTKGRKRRGILLAVLLASLIGTQPFVAAWLWVLACIVSPVVPRHTQLSIGLSLHGAISLGLFVCAIAAWNWKRWGVYGIGAFCLARPFVDLYIWGDQPVPPFELSFAQNLSMVVLVYALFLLVARRAWQHFH